MAKAPYDMTKVSAQDLIPEGRFRARVAKTEQRPKEVELGPDGEIPGKFSDKGTQSYGGLSVDFVFTEHSSNYAPNEKGDVVPLVGRHLFAFFGHSPNGPGRRLIAALYDNTGTPREAEYEALHGKEVDVVVKVQARYDDPETKESVVKKVLTPAG